MKYNESEIIALFEKSCDDGRQLLSSLKVAQGREPTANLSRWMFEQTIRYCLATELAARGLHPQMEEQVPLMGRAKVDLLVGRIALELKVGGAFGAGDEKYHGYRKTVEGKKWIYFYLTLAESHLPFKASTNKCFGEDRAFFLDASGDWKRFVEAVALCHK